VSKKKKKKTEPSSHTASAGDFGRLLAGRVVTDNQRPQNKCKAASDKGGAESGGGARSFGGRGGGKKPRQRCRRAITGSKKSQGMAKTNSDVLQTRKPLKQDLGTDSSEKLDQNGVKG